MKYFGLCLAVLLLGCSGGGEEISSFSEWQTYANQEHGFSVRYPAGTRLIEERGTYIRLQNYEADDIPSLEPGQFYLEVHVPQTPEREGFDSCKESVVEAREVKVGGFTAYRGYGEGGGDPGGERFMLCIDGGEKYFSVIATENHEEGPIANAILDSFTLR